MSVLRLEYILFTYRNALFYSGCYLEFEVKGKSDADIVFAWCGHVMCGGYKAHLS